MEATLYKKLLPVIIDNWKYIIFSPFSKKFISLSKEQFNNIDDLSSQIDTNMLWKFDQNVYKEWQLTIVTTNKCNLWCKYCYEDAWAWESISYETAIKWVDYIFSRSDKPIKILFHWWEPTLCMDLIEGVFNHIKTNYWNRKFQLHLITNGIFNDAIVETFKKINIAVTISCDWYPAIQNYNRPLRQGWDSAGIVESNILKLKEKWIPLQILSIITDKSVNKLDEIIKYFHNLWVDRIRLEPLIEEWRATQCHLNQPDWELFGINFIKALDLAKDLGVTLTQSSLFHLIDPVFTFCSCEKWNNITILPDNRIALCHELNAANEYQINTRVIGEYKDWKINIDMDRINKYDEKTNIENNKECAQCFAKLICGWGCPTRNMSKTNKLWELNENLCKLRKKIIKEFILRTYHNSLDDK